MPQNSRIRPTRPLWAAILGTVAVLFGALMAASAANELMVQLVIGPNTAAAWNVPTDCREDEAEEEEVSLAECELMVANVRIMLASRPPWFRSFQMGWAGAGILAALLSVLAGIALVDYRTWAPTAALVTFAALLALDVAGFLASIYTGPLLRATYLWNAILWSAIHLCLVTGAMTGRQIERQAALASPAAIA